MALVFLDVSSLGFFGYNYSQSIGTNYLRNLPLGGIAFIMVMMLLKPKPAKDEIRALTVLQRLLRMDWMGTMLFLAAFTCLFLALQWGGQTKPWRSSMIIGLFIGFGLLLGVFMFTQKFTGERSLLPRRVLRQRTVLSGTIYLIMSGLQLGIVS
jgi:hypothetical protein